MSVIELNTVGKTEGMISLTSVLTELKHLDSWFEAAEAQRTDLVSCSQDPNEPKSVVPGQTLEQVKSVLQSNLDGWERRIARYTQLRRALLSANAQAKVEVNGVTMTIIEAIDLRAQLNKKVKFLKQMESSFARNQEYVESTNAKLDVEQRELMRTQAASDNVSAETVELIRKSQEDNINARRLKLYDPLDVGDKIRSVKDEIESIDSTLDAILSEKNSSTFVEVK